jgi:SET and MYND domain-containing protein
MEFTKSIDIANDNIIINPFESCKVIIDSTKGRCFESTKEFKVGNLVFEENAFVYGKYDENINFTDECNFNLINKAYNTNKSNKNVNKKWIDDYNDALFEFSELESVQSMDTARCFMQLIAITKFRKSNQIHIIEDTLTNISENPINVLSISQKLQLFDLLGGANIDSCIEDIKVFRNLFPTIIDKSISNEDAGHILTVLNTNQIELEEFQGSGLFIGTAILEHNCSPNCSFTTTNDHLYLTAIKPIHDGDR